MMLLNNVFHKLLLGSRLSPSCAQAPHNIFLRPLQVHPLASSPSSKDTIKLSKFSLIEGERGVCVVMSKIITLCLQAFARVSY